jgi:hypothetical protein
LTDEWPEKGSAINLGIVVKTGKRIVVRFTQGCAESGCEKAWSITRHRMLQLDEAKWGNTLCYRHGSIFFGVGRPPSG